MALNQYNLNLKLKELFSAQNFRILSAEVQQRNYDKIFKHISTGTGCFSHLRSKIQDPCQFITVDKWSAFIKLQQNNISNVLANHSLIYNATKYIYEHFDHTGSIKMLRRFSHFFSCKCGQNVHLLKCDSVKTTKFVQYTMYAFNAFV